MTLIQWAVKYYEFNHFALKRPKAWFTWTRVSIYSIIIIIRLWWAWNTTSALLKRYSKWNFSPWVMKNDSSNKDYLQRFETRSEWPRYEFIHFSWRQWLAPPGTELAFLFIGDSPTELQFLCSDIHSDEQNTTKLFRTWKENKRQFLNLTWAPKLVSRLFD